MTRDIFFPLAVFLTAFWIANAPADPVEKKSAPYRKASASGDTALWQTKQVLSNPTKRQEFINSSPEARALDRNIEEMTGSKVTKEKIYGVSTRLFENIVSKSKSNPAAVRKIIQEAQSDPKAFYDSMSPEDQQAVRDIASEIEQNKRPLE